MPRSLNNFVLRTAIAYWFPLGFVSLVYMFGCFKNNFAFILTHFVTRNFVVLVLMSFMSSKIFLITWYREC